MSTNSKIHQIRLNEWAARLADQKSSGLSVPQWCEKNGVTTHKYFYWKRLLKSQVVDQVLPDIVPVQLPSVSELVPQTQIPSTTYTSCTTCTSCASARVFINGISIELDSSASEEFIRTLIKAVRYA